MKILPEHIIKKPGVDCRKALFTILYVSGRNFQQYWLRVYLWRAGVFNKRGAKYSLIFSDPRRRLLAFMDSGLPPGGSGMTTR